MSEPPAQGGEWRPIADQIAANVKNFIDGVDALARTGGDETVPMLLLEVSQILLAGAQLGASRDVILPGNWEPQVSDDPDLLWRVGVAVWERYNGPYTEEMRPFVEALLHKRVAVRVRAERVRSWDHRKLGLPATGPATGTTVAAPGRRPR